MATYKLKRKTFAFARTIANFNAAKTAFNAGNFGEAAKLGGAALGRGALGVAKVAAPVAAIGMAGKGVMDKVTGEDVNNTPDF